VERVRLSSKGQVIIPKTIRQQLRLRQGVELQVKLVNGKIVMEPAQAEPHGWQRWQGSMRGTGILEDHLTEHREEVWRDG